LAIYGSVYDSWIIDMKGVFKRSAFVIDKEGIVRYAEVLEQANEEHDFANVEKALKKLN
jgi:peroxiredoxin